MGTCPRCGLDPNEGPYYAPCEPCQEDLREWADHRRFWRWLLGHITVRWHLDPDGKTVLTGGWA